MGNLLRILKGEDPGDASGRSDIFLDFESKVINLVLQYEKLSRANFGNTVEPLFNNMPREH